MNLTGKIESEKLGGKDLEYPKFPMRFDKLDHSQMTEPPILGEHTDSILHDTLKYSKAKI